MTAAQDRYNAATQRLSDALQRAIDREAAAVSLLADNEKLKADLAQARADYDALLDKTSVFVESAADSLDANHQPAAAPSAPASA